MSVRVSQYVLDGRFVQGKGPVRTGGGSIWLASLMAFIPGIRNFVILALAFAQHNAKSPCSNGRRSLGQAVVSRPALPLEVRRRPR